MIEMDELRFKAGFNSGYLFAEFEPEMLKMILNNIKADISFILGMQSGQLEYQTYLETQELTKLRSIKSRDGDSRDL